MQRAIEKNKLGICLGPLAFSNSDDEVRRLISDGFEIARRNDVAIAFHIDDQMFWEGRKDFIGQENIEWIDWKGTACTGRRLDWSATPLKAAPQLCLNSPTIQRAVATRARLIGAELKKQIQVLKNENKEYLYAGIIAGWESMIGRDFDSGKHTGFHALSNRGFSSAQPPAQIDIVLSNVIKQFIELWARELIQAGAPRDKVYCHIAFTPQGFAPPEMSTAEAMGFATPEIAFSKWYQPGFSLYPLENTLEAIREPLHKHNDPQWIMSEGTNVVPNGMPGESTMETYLGKLFNHGAVLANIFSWGIGGDAERDRNMFRRATENREALSAYRKFLTGQQLIETPRSSTEFSVTRLRQKLDKIQKEIPSWVSGKPERAKAAQSLMERLDRSIKSSNPQQADATADEVLQLLKK